MGVRCNRKKLALKQNPKTKQQQKKIWRLGFKVGVSAGYTYFRRVRNFDFV